MNEVIDFETYLVISNDKFEIYLLDIKNCKNLYKKEVQITSKYTKKIGFFEKFFQLFS